ncbi:MAG: HEPN domain-containing protein [Candidatus Marsarchaeota archaeon]|nr:HEPN domain-containing protein [Candidatus Marsarchaeota archaeon]
MRKGVDLLKRAVRDYELARKYRDAKEYVTASILYRKATEKVLKALFMKSSKKTPPSNATIEYLAERTQLPEDMYNGIVEMPDETTELFEDEGLAEYDDVEQTHMAEEKEYSRTMVKHDLVRRLLDYAEANI